MEALAPAHIILMAVIFLFVFGAKRIPEMGAGLGKGIRAFKQGMRDDLPEDSGPAAPAPEDRGPKKLSE